VATSSATSRTFARARWPGPAALPPSFFHPPPAGIFPRSWDQRAHRREIDQTHREFQLTASNGRCVLATDKLFPSTVDEERAKQDRRDDRAHLARICGSVHPPFLLSVLGGNRWSIVCCRDH
jgi:hypothetical protein